MLSSSLVYDRWCYPMAKSDIHIGNTKMDMNSDYLFYLSLCVLYVIFSCSSAFQVIGSMFVIHVWGWLCCCVCLSRVATLFR